MDDDTMVIEKDHPDFTTRWERALKQCEETLVQTLMDHLARVMEETNIAIRATTKQAYGALKSIHLSGAKEVIKDTLKEAEQTQTEKAETRKKKELKG